MAVIKFIIANEYQKRRSNIAGRPTLLKPDGDLSEMFQL